MSETSVKITLELADKAAQKSLSDFIAKGSSAEKSLNKLKDTGSGTFEEIGLHIGKATGLYDIFVGNLAANLAIKGLEVLTEAARGLFDTFIIEGVHAAAEAEVAVNNLNVALAQNGHYSKETSKSFQEYAAQLQRTTAFSDDAVIQNAALLESMAQLDEKGLKRATLAAVNLAAAYQKDLPSATQALAKAAEGNVTALQKMGIEIQKGRTDAETFANALKAVEARVGSAASGQVVTYAGAVSQAGNAFNDFQESVGRLIVQNPAFISAINAAASLFADWAEAVDGNNESMKSFVGEGLSIFLTTLAYGNAILDTTVRVFQTLYGAVQALTAPFLPLTIIIRSFSVGLSQAAQEADKFLTKAGQNITALGDSGDGALGKITEGLLRIRDGADKGLDALAKGASGAVEPTNNAAAAVKNLTEEQKRAQAVLKAFAEDLIKQSSDAKTSADQQLTIAQAKADNEQTINQSLLDQKVISIVDFETRKQAIEAQFELDRVATDAAKHEADQARLEQALAQNLISDTEYIKAKTALDNQYAANQVKLDAENFKNDVKNKEALTRAERNLNEQKVSAVADTFSALSSLMQTKSRELFEIGKAAAIAAATINTYQAVTKTMTEVPYPFNIPLAVAQGIAGFVQVANIASTSPRFQDGGIVGGNSLTGDQISARVNSGEMILNRQQQSSLFAMANGAGGGTSIDYGLMAAAFRAGVAEQPITLNIDGKEVFAVIRSGLQSGRSFA